MARSCEATLGVSYSPTLTSSRPFSWPRCRRSAFRAVGIAFLGLFFRYTREQLLGIGVFPGGGAHGPSSIRVAFRFRSSSH
jgi:hypothetical protein